MSGKMLESWFGKSLGARRAKSRAAAGAPLDLARIKTLIDFFPIGKKLRYYPEFKQDIVFDTLLLAYCVNGSFVYSADGIERDPDGTPTAFCSAEGSVRTAAARLTSFQLLVPDTSNLETKLDYDRWAQIGRGRQFTVGNCISLIANAGGKGVSTIDTAVARPLDLPEGPYAHHPMVLLTPDLDTLSVSDQRKSVRTRLNAPVTLILPEKTPAGPCLIIDISEDELRIRVRARGTPMAPVQRGDVLFIETRTGSDDAQRRYVIKASVIRRSAETCVVKLHGQVSGGKLVPFSPLDLLELKAGLLNGSR